MLRLSYLLYRKLLIIIIIITSVAGDADSWTAEQESGRGNGGTPDTRPSATRSGASSPSASSPSAAQRRHFRRRQAERCGRRAKGTRHRRLSRRGGGRFIGGFRGACHRLVIGLPKGHESASLKQRESE